MNSNRHFTTLGKFFLVFAVFINGALLFVNLHLNSIESSLTELRNDEYYLMINQQTASTEFNKSAILDATANQMIMLRRLSKQYLLETEDRTVRAQIIKIQESVEKSLRDITAMYYHMANDVDSETNPFQFMRNVEKDSLGILSLRYADQAFEAVVKLKRKMRDLSSRVSKWRGIQSFGLILNMLSLVFGSAILFWENIRRNK